MTRHPIQHVISIVAGLALAGCAASTAPPSKPVARQTARAPAQEFRVQVPAGSTYVTPPASDPRTTYVVEVASDNSALAATRAQLAKTQRELAATREALAKGTGKLDELRARERELTERQAALTAQSEQLRSEQEARAQAQRERDIALARLREIEKIKVDQRGLVISMGGTLMFRHDDATLLPEARARLDRVADALKQMAPGQKIVIEGHADAVGTDEYNLRLSEHRANAVRTYLLQRGVAPERISAVGRGESEPIAPNQTAEGRANNRRVEIVVSPAQTASAG